MFKINNGTPEDVVIPQVPGYAAEKMTINLVKANVFAGLLLIPLLALFIPFFLLWGRMCNVSGGLWILAIACVVGIVVHELIHGLAWKWVSHCSWKDISFGILKKMYTPYCHCEKPLLVRHYKVGALAPLVVLGVIPTILAFCFGWYGALLFGILFIDMAGGDIMIVWKIRHESPSSLVYDHPSDAGCFVFRKIE